MNKLTKLLSVFVIAGAVGAGVAGISACKKEPTTPTHEHEAATAWQSDDTKHWHNCTADDGYKFDEADHVYDNEQDTDCNVCGHIREVSGGGVTDIEVPANAVGVKVTLANSNIALDQTNKSVVLTLADISASYIDASMQTIEGETVDLSKCTIEILKGNTSYELGDTLLEGSYEVYVTVNEDIFGSAILTITNDYVSLALKEGTTTQVQGIDVISSTWKFEATKANGDKEEIPAANIEIGTIDTNTAGQKTVTITIKGTSISFDLTYNITADATKVAQSYAMNFSYLTSAQETSIANGEAVSLQDGRFVIQSTTGGLVDSHNKEYNGQYFVKRLKVNGASNKSGCSRYIKVKADGAGTITVVAYNNGSDTRGVELYSSRTADAAGDTYDGKIGDTLSIDSKTHGSATFTIPGAGEYYITCNNAMTFCYVQLDQLVDAGTGVEEVALGGETIVSKIEVTKPATVTNFKVGDAFTHEGYTVTATGVNNVTCVSGTTDVTAQAEFVEPDMTTIGKKTVTVNYNGLSATYEVIVETAVDGIYGATATLSTTLNTEAESADGTVLVKKSDVLVALVGESANATSTYTVTYGDSNTELTEEGAQFAIGSHTLNVVVTVSDGTNNDTINVEVALSVTQKIEGELTTLATYTVGLEAGAITNTAPDTVTVTNNGTTLDTDNYKFSSNSNSLVLDVAGLKAGQQVEITINCKSGSSSSAVTVSATVSGSATGTFTSDALSTSYTDIAAGTYTVSADGTVTITIVRGGATLRMTSVTVVVKGVA